MHRSTTGRMSQPIYFFTRTEEWFELSNFYPYGFEEDGKYWPTVEHYFQVMKFEDEAYREKIRKTPAPERAKQLGRSRKVPIRRNWDNIRDDVMLHALRKKFAHPDMRKVLLQTGQRELIENSPYDSYWGRREKSQGQKQAWYTADEGEG
jgi:hypothetical protein